MRNSLRVVILMLATLIGSIWLVSSQQAQAAVTYKYTLGGSYYSVPTSLSRVPGTGTGSTLTSSSVAVKSVKVDAATAGSDGGYRVTSATKNIQVTLSGSMILNPSNSGETFKSITMDVLSTVNGSKNDPKKSVVTTPATPKTVSGTTASPSTTYTMEVDLSGIKDNMPLYIALNFSTNLTTDNYYSAAILLNNTTTLKPDLLDAATGGELTTKTTGVLVGDTSASGVGGNALDLTFNGITLSSSFPATYAGPITMDLGSNKLVSGSTVTLKERNVFGDYAIKTATVADDPPTISATTTSLSLLPDEVSDVSGLSDGDFITWLVKKVTVVGKDATGSSDGITIKSDTTGFASIINGLSDGDSTTINLYAENSNGTKSDTLGITITKQPGTLSFDTISTDVGFGNITIPNSETLYAPTSNWNVTVNDTRAAGSDWTVFASATAMQNADKTRTLKGNLVYQDGSNKTVMTGNSVPIKQGTKVAGTTTTDVTGDWYGTGNKGIYLDVQPGVYADSYSGIVEWSFTNTPVD